MSFSEQVNSEVCAERFTGQLLSQEPPQGVQDPQGPIDFKPVSPALVGIHPVSLHTHSHVLPLPPGLPSLGRWANGIYSRKSP